MSLLIRDIAKEERPRERLIKYGVSSLSSAELLAIVIKTGTKNCSVKTLSEIIIGDSMDNLKNMSFSKLKNIQGIGNAKACEILAALELGKRVYFDNTLPNKIFLNSSEKIFNYFKYNLNESMQECFYCIYLDHKKNLIESVLLFKGTINKSIIHPREIFKKAYSLSASSIVCIHNHPSGDVIPSKEDLTVTKQLVEIGKLLGIPVIDHIIIGNNNYYSFFENGDL